MTDTPDPRLVRDFARRAIQSAVEDVDYIGVGEQFGDEENWPQDRDAFDTMQDAVYEAVGEATVFASWPAATAQEAQDLPLTDAELDELTASIEHLSGPDAWAEDELEPALIPVTHYVPRLLTEVRRFRALMDVLAERGSSLPLQYPDGSWR